MKTQLRTINKCEVCDNTDLSLELNLGYHPMCDDLIKVEINKQNNEYPIKILYCNKCFTAHQKFQIPKQELFPLDYHYRAKFTKDVLDGMKQLVENIEFKYGSIQGKKVLDIGCNDGSLLDFFKEKGAMTFGVEPTGANFEAAQKGHYIVNAYFDKKVAENHIKPDIITFTNVFAHIEDLEELINNLKLIMNENTLLVIENHYLGAVLEKNQFDTFYHEHPRTYSLNSFYHIAKKLNREVIDYEFPSRYGGNIRVIIGKGTSVNFKEIFDKELNFSLEFKKMNKDINIWKIEKQKEIQEAINKYGLLEAKAFPGRSAIPIKMLELNENHILKVYEKPGSLKIGYKVPGTNIPIVSDDDMGDLSQKPVLLNLAWHISSEIEKYLRSKGFKGQLINII